MFRAFRVLLSQRVQAAGKLIPFFSHTAAICV